MGKETKRRGETVSVGDLRGDSLYRLAAVSELALIQTSIFGITRSFNELQWRIFCAVSSILA